MNATLACPHCAAKLKAPPQTFGKTLKCPNCREPLQIPMQVKVRESMEVVPMQSFPPPIPVEQPPSEIDLLRQELRELRQDRSQERPTVVYHTAQPTILIEQTSKKWKAIQLAGGLIGSFTLFLICAGIAGNPEHNRQAVGTLVVTSLAAWLLYLYGKIGAWWNHG